MLICFFFIFLMLEFQTLLLKVHFWEVVEWWSPICSMFNRPDVEWLRDPFPLNLQNTKSLELGTWSLCTMFTTCHVSRVMCHLEPVTCHMSPVIFWPIGGGSWWKVCYQRGPPRLVTYRIFQNSTGGTTAKYVTYTKVFFMILKVVHKHTYLATFYLAT